MPFQPCSVNASSPTATKVFIPTNVGSTISDDDGDNFTVDVFYFAVKYVEDGAETSIAEADYYPSWFSHALVNETVTEGVRTADVQITLDDDEVKDLHATKTTEYVKFGVTVDDGVNTVTDYFWYTPTV